MKVALLALIGGTIVLGLALYAGYLLLQLKKQKDLQRTHQTEALNRRNNNIFENVDLLCRAGLQGQCDLSEVCIRVYSMMEYIQGEQFIHLDTSFPSISELYHIVKEMARGDSRQQLSKQERMKQNLIRHKAESRLMDAIMEELRVLQEQVVALKH